MDIEIVEIPLCLNLYGVSGKVGGENLDISSLGFNLMNTMWNVIGSNEQKNKGINHWVYQDANSLFVGVELIGELNKETGLVENEISIPRYAAYKHIGEYRELGSVHSAIHNFLKKNKIRSCYPYLEIYGHWTEDSSKLETNVIVGIA